MKPRYSAEQVAALVQVAGGADQARAVLEVLGETAALWSLDVAAQHHFARHHLALRTPRAEIVRRMVQRFGLHERTAWRRVHDALQSPLS
jgi:hypothetical protein